MFGKIKELTRKVTDVKFQCERLERKYLQCIQEYSDLADNLRIVRRQVNCHDCQRYPAIDELTTAFCKVCEDSCFRLKLKVESDVPKKTCLDDMDLFKK